MRSSSPPSRGLSNSACGSKSDRREFLGRYLEQASVLCHQRSCLQWLKELQLPLAQELPKEHRFGVTATEPNLENGGGTELSKYGVIGRSGKEYYSHRKHKVLKAASQSNFKVSVKRFHNRNVRKPFTTVAV